MKQCSAMFILGDASGVLNLFENNNKRTRFKLAA